MTAQTTEKMNMVKGEARCPNAPSTQDIIAKDNFAAPGWVRSESYKFLGDEDIPTERYYEEEFAHQEYQNLWTRTWQFTCREEHIPEVGDYYVYDIGRKSFIITRVAENEVRAYYNACLHRGTKLRASGTDGCASEFKCVFHGWTWNIDGSLQKAQCEWDFPHVKAEEFSLPQAKVQSLAGFVFINMDLDAPALEEYLGDEFMSHLNAWKLEDRYVHCHVSKIIPANWKLTMEAFMEAYHVIETHPQVAVSNADANSQYDFYGEHVDRFISPLGVISPHLAGQYTEQEIFDQFTIGDSGGVSTSQQLGEDETARAAMAKMFRGMFEEASDSDLSYVSDSELLDCFSYTVFPNMFMFAGISLPMVYRFRPVVDDHRKTLFEVFFLRPLPKTGERPEPAEQQHMADDQSFVDAEGMDDGFGVILDQDTENLLLQQQGVEASAKKGLTLGNYQEIRVRHFELAIDKYVSGK
jgi:phenylpropionate dioxygenase-like ring-hydroxylating dioxygenase large terminal subunit